MIKILVDEETDVDNALHQIERKLAESARQSPSYQIIRPQLTTCIQDYITRYQRNARAGTNISMKKEFVISGDKVVIQLDYPRKYGIVNKALSWLTGGG